MCPRLFMQRAGSAIARPHPPLRPCHPTNHSLCRTPSLKRDLPTALVADPCRGRRLPSVTHQALCLTYKQAVFEDPAGKTRRGVPTLPSNQQLRNSPPVALVIQIQPRWNESTTTRNETTRRRGRGAHRTALPRASRAHIPALHARHGAPHRRRRRARGLRRPGRCPHCKPRRSLWRGTAAAPAVCCSHGSRRTRRRDARSC